MTDSAITKKSKRSIWIPLLVLITLAACSRPRWRSPMLIVPFLKLGASAKPLEELRA